MATPTPTISTNGPTATKAPRKKAERIPRTPQEVAFSSCNNVLKRLPNDEIRKNVMKSLSAIWGAS